MPGANAYGTLAKRPMTSVPTALAMIVAKKTACAGIPVCDRTWGLTNKIYDIAKNVVRPAMTSVIGVVLLSFK
mgnify:CR=1 FL=1